jgi:hypothetical protein
MRRDSGFALPDGVCGFNLRGAHKRKPLSSHTVLLPVQQQQIKKINKSKMNKNKNKNEKKNHLTIMKRAAACVLLIGLSVVSGRPSSPKVRHISTEWRRL